MALAFLAPQASPSTSRSEMQAAPGQSLAQLSEASSSSFRPAALTASASLAVASLGLGLNQTMRRRLRRQAAMSVARQATKTAPLAVPGLPEPAYRQFKDPLLGECDAGFDPLDLATQASPFGKGPETYYNYREAEVKHGRLAMLAATGWLSSEELQASLAQKLGLTDALAKGEMAPSLVNGGLNDLPGWFLPAVFMISSWIELVPKRQGNRDDVLKYKPQQGRIPGDLSFDPLALRPTIEALGTSVQTLHNSEVKHGRAAMLGIVGFVLQEFITKVPVLDEDQLSADRVVATLDKGIDTIDKVAGLQIPEIPQPFPMSNFGL